ncbi:hypothetical protein MLD38_019499 [Melastoma candidum]|uniref:Uncharacterized protein n=1 Tax=Melastoma candidum TaxID=119954 RepID=A0ACB9QYG9_9MYRT|nr:hypothetical protein MLD38_019499 [Melastoma candidum]
MALRILQQSVSKTIYPRIYGLKKVNEVWDVIKKEFKGVIEGDLYKATEHLERLRQFIHERRRKIQRLLIKNHENSQSIEELRRSCHGSKSRQKVVNSTEHTFC